MKSTSSRFSFDMIGATKQEKIMEERHRQKAAERKTMEPISSMQRDSRFDDIDDFDYDAMMVDDGPEEEIPEMGEDYDEDFEDPIPGVNVDHDEEPIPGMDDSDGEEPVPEVGDDYDDEGDPDNDQENFSSFIFQRSNPASALTSPQSAGMIQTPRDADGHVIGFAMSKDGETPGLEPRVVSLSLPSGEDTRVKSVDLSGLGIHGLAIADDTAPPVETEPVVQHAIPPFVKRRNKVKDDDLYYNDGMIGLEGEEFANEFEPGDDAKFDESIFDNNDTDEYGRHIPGAFARAQAAAQQAATQQSQSKRESDITSSLSAQERHAVVAGAVQAVALGLGHHGEPRQQPRRVAPVGAGRRHELAVGVDGPERGPPRQHRRPLEDART